MSEIKNSIYGRFYHNFLFRCHDKFCKLSAREEAFIGDTTGSIAQAAQAATAAAIAAAVSAAHAAVVPNITIMRGPSSQNDASFTNTDSSTTSLGDVNLNLNLEGMKSRFIIFDCFY